jgi:hypothetical protein
MNEKTMSYAELEAEIERLKQALEDIDDHGRALEAMERLKAQATEIARLKAETETTVAVCNENTDLKRRVQELSEDAAQLAWWKEDAQDLFTEMADELERWAGPNDQEVTLKLIDSSRELARRAREAAK